MEANKPAPTPWDWQASGQAGSNGLFNLYIVDANGRKIAAVWGKPGEKEATCRMFVAAPALFEMVLLFEKTIRYEIARSVTAGDHEGARLKTVTLNLVCDAIALTREDGAAHQAAPLAPLVDSDSCPGHVASTHDPKICGRCGIHVDELR